VNAQCQHRDLGRSTLNLPRPDRVPNAQRRWKGAGWQRFVQNHPLSVTFTRNRTVPGATTRHCSDGAASQQRRESLPFRAALGPVPPSAARVDDVVVAAADAGEIQYLCVEGSVLNFADD
jgi:hypothetical protein